MSGNFGNLIGGLGTRSYSPYISATGGTITTDGDFQVHTFTSSGTFNVINGGGVGNQTVEYLIVAGGGGGGAPVSYTHLTLPTICSV